jgi:branched-subunit amino acid ABC-type transport system permease component
VDLALQVLVSGLAAGGVYGLVAAGYSLVYRLTGIVHFALGDLIGVGVFATLAVVAGTGPVTQTSTSGARLALGLAVGLVTCVIAGGAVYYVALQPWVERGSTIGWVGTVVAVAFAIRAGLSAIFDRPAYVFPDPFPFRHVGNGGFVSVGDASIQIRSFLVIGVAVALAFASERTLTRTRFGRALQAVADDREGARIVGIPVDRVVTMAFALAGGVAALAAVVAAPSGAFSVDTATLIGVKGLVAALVVRFGSIWHAFAAGLALGVLESSIAGLEVDGHVLGSAYREVLPLALALAWLALRRLPEAEEQLE